MAKITLADVLAQFASQQGLNNRFTQIENEFNNKVLYRDEPGAMARDLDGNYILTDNIDCNASSHWNGAAGLVPIGSLDNPFRGTLDGQDHAVSGLFIERDESGIGLFGAVGDRMADPRRSPAGRRSRLSASLVAPLVRFDPPTQKAGAMPWHPSRSSSF